MFQANASLDGESSSKGDEAFRALIQDFFKTNPKTKAVLSHLRINLAEKAINVSKIFSMKVQSSKDLSSKNGEFETPSIKFSIQGGMHTFFDIQEANYLEKEARYASNAIEEAEKLTLDFIQTIVTLNLKLQLASYMEQYIIACRKDAKEAEARAKNNDISIEEKAEFRGKLAEAETSYEKLKGDIETSQQLLDLYYYDEFDEDDELPSKEKKNRLNLSLDDLESLSSFDDINVGSASLVKSEYALERAKNGLFKQSVSFFPYFKLGGKIYLSDSAYREKSNVIRPEKDQATLEIGVDLSPKGFFETHKAQATYEHAKNNFIWEKRKYNFEQTKMNNRLSSFRSSLGSAKLALESKKLALEAALSQYNAGYVVYTKVAYARKDYYHALENYFKIAQEYVGGILEQMKLTGKLRTVFLEIIDEEIGV